MSRTRERRLRVFLVGTEFFRSYGGIQYVNRLLVRALCEMSTRTPLDLEVLAISMARSTFPRRWREERRCVGTARSATVGR